MEDKISIKRIDTYKDKRFTQKILNQHGCFLVNDIPVEIEIISEFEAIIHGVDSMFYSELIEEFRFYTPHITCFYDEKGYKIKEYSRNQIITLKLNDIQPSQFYVDEDKVAAIDKFIQKPEDIIIPVLPYKERYISLDGHTRLYYAVSMGWDHIRAVIDSSNEWVYKFADEAIKRGITVPSDLILVDHDEYEEKWNQFCDDFFKEFE